MTAVASGEKPSYRYQEGEALMKQRLVRLTSALALFGGVGTLALASPAFAGGSHGQAHIYVYYNYVPATATFDITAPGAENGFDSTALSDCTLTVDKVAQTNVSYSESPNFFNGVYDGNCDFSSVDAGNTMVATGTVIDEGPFGTGTNYSKSFSITCRKAQTSGCSGSILLRINT